MCEKHFSHHRRLTFPFPTWYPKSTLKSWSSYECRKLCLISVHNHYGLQPSHLSYELKPSQLLGERYYFLFAKFLLNKTDNSQHLRRHQHWAQLSAVIGDSGLQWVVGCTFGYMTAQGDIKHQSLIFRYE